MNPNLEEINDKRRQSGLRTKSLFGNLNASFLLSKGNNAVHLTAQNPLLVPKEDFKQSDQCQICFTHFSTLFRKHHCRLCGQSVCSLCSGSTINKQRMCDVCAFSQCNMEMNQKKQKILKGLKNLNKQMIGKKIDEQYKQKTIEAQVAILKKEQQEDAQDNARRLAQLTKQLENITNQRIRLEATLEQIQSK